MTRVRGWIHWREVYLAQLERAVRAEDFALPGAEIAQTEARFTGEWQGFEVVGRVDRIDRTPEGLVFVDYKSCRRGESGGCRPQSNHTIVSTN